MGAAAAAAVARRVGVQGEDARRGQEMEEEEARHYFPKSALQARSSIAEPVGKLWPL